MKIALAQIRPRVGQFEDNLSDHLNAIRLAAELGARLVVFPELSLTGYEPQIAESQVRRPDDRCFDKLQAIADERQLKLVVGVPTPGHRLPRISSLIFSPDSNVQVYSKQFLHEDELPYFEPGPVGGSQICHAPNIALTICFELTVPEHIDAAIEQDSAIYVASVAKTRSGVEAAWQRLGEIASSHSIYTMMTNSLGIQDGVECAGGSAAWRRDGTQLIALGASEEGILVLDVRTEQTTTTIIERQLP